MWPNFRSIPFSHLKIIDLFPSFCTQHHPSIAAEAWNPHGFVVVHRWVYVQNIEQHRAQYDAKWINPSHLQVRIVGI